MKDAYEVLGLDRNASVEELQARYENLKKEYGEGRFKSGAEGMQAARNLNALENAWQDITDELKVKQETQNVKKEEKIEELTAEEVKKESSESAETFAFIEKLIKDGKYDEAQQRLDNVMDRNGEWHYLQSKIFYHRDWLSECKKQLEIAVNSDKDNKKYKSALDNLEAVMGNKNADPSKIDSEMSGEGDRYGYGNVNQTQGNSLMSCCSTYCLVSMCCDTCSLCCRV